MDSVIILSLCAVVCVGMARFFSPGKQNSVILEFSFFVAGFFVFFILVFFTSPKEFGWGHVPDKAEEFTKRLEIGVVYHLAATVKDGEDQILLLRKSQIKDFHTEFLAIRVKGKVSVPEFFTPVEGGHLVAITELK